MEYPFLVWKTTLGENSFISRKRLNAPSIDIETVKSMLGQGLLANKYSYFGNEPNTYLYKIL